MERKHTVYVRLYRDFVFFSIKYKQMVIGLELWKHINSPPGKIMGDAPKVSHESKHPAKTVGTVPTKNLAKLPQFYDSIMVSIFSLVEKFNKFLLELQF